MEPSTQPVISQKDYLKKYFSKSKTDKPKKKKVKLSSSSHLKRSQIIDDDLNLNSMADVDDCEFNLSYLGDEAPQIAGIIDERPDHIKALESYGDKKKWKPISEESGSNVNAINSKSNDKSMFNDEVVSKNIPISDGNYLGKKVRKEIDCFDENVKRLNKDRDSSPIRKTTMKHNRIRGYEDDEPFADKNEKYERRKRRSSDDDLSPTRKTMKSDKDRRKEYEHKQSPPRKVVKSQRKDHFDKHSPPRRNFEKNHSRRSKDSGDDLSPSRKTSVKSDKRQFRDSDSDQSPVRRNTVKTDKYQRRDTYSDLSPPRKNSGRKDHYQRKGSEDQSPPRRKQPNNDKYQRRDSGNDLSPPRKATSKNNKYRRRNSDEDQSPPRRTLTQSDKYQRKYSDSDLSPSRTTNKNNERRGSDSDQSPPRRSTKVFNRYKKRGSDSDMSPPRKITSKNGKHQNINSEEDQSPPRKTFNKYNKIDRKYSDRDQSPLRKNSSQYRDRSHTKKEPYMNARRYSPGRNNSPDRNKNRVRDSDKYHSKPSTSNEEKTDFSDFKKSFSKLEKTLDGKKAGLQDAKNLREELATLRAQEDKIFRNMDTSKLGVGSEVVVRDRKTGQVKDFAKEQEESAEKMRERLAREEKYTRWGKGLKQLEDASLKAADNVHEMSKPLARYKDDNDLDSFLKAQEREGDPMLDYIRKKQSESHSVEKLKPQYVGSFGPNRFNIRPGHRWDGVDRSNGYEAKWFESINAKKAIQEEAYKWSSADM